MPYQNEIKAIKLLQERSASIASAHEDIFSDLAALKAQLAEVDTENLLDSAEFRREKTKYLAENSQSCTPLVQTSIKDIYQEAEAAYVGKLGLGDILSQKDFIEAERRIDLHVADFNKRYGLDKWDYAIAAGCGLFAAMLDILCVRAPALPTAPYTAQVDGIFNRMVQDAFNKLLPPDVSDTLSKQFPIGAPDSSIVTHLTGAPAKALNPMNHRLRALSHDPILGIIFGVWDMIHGTCTTVVNGKIVVIPSTKAPVKGNVFQLIGRMFGHLLSDVNAVTKNGNRGMGLPAPFMGLLRMLECIPVGNSNFGKQIEWMYIHGYDFRQFITTSIPMSIMEVLMRVFYVGKQVKLYGAGFGESIVDTIPLHLNPRFRIMLAIAYGTSSAVNAGKVYVTHNLLNANYASWMGLAWNGFHALKWALYSKHIKLWELMTQKEIEELEGLVSKLDNMQVRASYLPC